MTLSAMEESELSDKQLENGGAITMQSVQSHSEYDYSMYTHAIKNKDPLLLQKLCLPKPAKSITRGIGTSPGAQQLTDALSAADENLKAATAHRTWRGNVARRNQMALGIFSTLFGFCKGIYDLLKIDDPDADHILAGFNVASDLSMIGGGVYLMKLAIQNEAAEGEYQQAQVMKLMIEYAQARAQDA